MPTAGEAIALPNFTNQNHFPELTKRSPTVPKSDTFGKAKIPRPKQKERCLGKANTHNNRSVSIR